MRDGRLLRVIKFVALCRFRIDLAVTRFILKLRGEPHYRLTGSCNGCGACCEAPTIRVHPLLFNLKPCRDVILAWHLHVNGFEYVSEDKETFSFTFRCSHYDRETKQCDSYDSRPGMCRDYPRNLIYGVNPQFFPDCSLKATAKNAASFIQALDSTDLTPEQREKLHKELHLDV
ncbi:MAG: YkgJ family cysteine cluster protein [Acidobacteriota bacterium]|nr:YkgJ family cysteine cluster protein [Acidobacteriota bacterium]